MPINPTTPQVLIRQRLSCTILFLEILREYKIKTAVLLAKNLVSMLMYNTVLNVSFTNLKLLTV